MVLSQDDSMRITSMRFILMMFVVFLHSASGLIQNPSLALIRNLFTTFAQASVYVFFIFSSYLLFLKSDSYSVMIVKKTKSLLIPYILWPTFYLLLFIFIKCFASLFFPSMLKNPWKLINSGWTVFDYIKYYFCYGGNLHNPFFSQFWFLRQLIFMIIISPLVKFLINKFPFETLILLFICSLFFQNIDDFIYVVLINPFICFYIGALFAHYKISFFELTDKLNWRFLIFSFGFLFILENFFNFNANSIMNNLLKSIILIKFSKLLIPVENDGEVKNLAVFNVLKQLSYYSFFLYAMHMPLMTKVLNKVFLHFFDLRNDYILFLHFFYMAFLNIIISVFIGVFINKLFPKFFKLLNGGR